MKLIFIILLAVSLPTFAADTYLDVNLASYHWGREDVSQNNLNETNPGIGIEHDTGEWRQMAGVYLNSIRRTTVYALLGYTPLHLDRLSVGAVGGMVTGYFAEVLPAVGLIATLQFECIGINIIAVPNAHVMHKEVNGFAGLQVRYKLNGEEC